MSPSRRRPLRSVAALALLGALGTATPASAATFGDGVRVDRERAIVSTADGQQRITLSLDVQAQGERARRVVLVPVPAPPTVEVVPQAQTRAFVRLATATAPVRADGSAGPPDAELRALGRPRVDGFGVAELRGRRGPAAERELARWARRHGYARPLSDTPALRDYARRGWSFVAIELARDTLGDEPRALRPLTIRYAADRTSYPLGGAAGADAATVVLYAVGAHRVLASGFDTAFAGTVAGLRPPLGDADRALLRGTYLTRLQASGRSAARNASVALRRGTSDRPFRATPDYPFESERGFATSPLPPSPDAARDDVLDDAPPGAAWLLLFPVVGLLVAVTWLVARRRGRR
ncbi:DUF2330 domain-containing protein [Patulibacter brassicae]|uniref:DUF2330 domain-containing protein n=1 Tax=Patulibacter brassicae TaxID=1705717 RepID=A0ABU4VGU9_9ACTN|nr:DUF2330 domain-containing protein [Patulibacter brassicae]MDX8150065.1 DUF2330 domain-containing protein [Patulibacter brassicae]